MFVMTKIWLLSPSLSSCHMCVAGPWGSQAQKECDFSNPSGLHQSAHLSYTEPNLAGTAAGLQSPVQFLPEEHSFPGLYIQQTSHSKRDMHYHFTQEKQRLLAFDHNTEMCYVYHHKTLSLQTDNLCFLYCP